MEPAVSYRYAQAAKLAGEEWVGTHECVALVQQYAKTPTTMYWREGSKVRGNRSLQEGTAIATFSKGKYVNRRTGNHAALYLSQDSTGIWVIEQFRSIKKGRIAKRHISFKCGKDSPSNDGDAYSVIE